MHVFLTQNCKLNSSSVPKQYIMTGNPISVKDSTQNMLAPCSNSSLLYRMLKEKLSSFLYSVNENELKFLVIYSIVYDWSIFNVTNSFVIGYCVL